MDIKQQFLELHRQVIEIKAQIEKPREEILTGKKLAILLGVSRQTIHRWKKDGVIKSYVLGGKVFYKRSQVLAAIENGEVKTN